MKDSEQMELGGLTLSPEDSPARISVSPENSEALMPTGQDYGLTSPELLANFHPDTQSWRTSQRCFLETEADGLDEFLETWPKSGMTVNGTAYRLETLMDCQPAHHTEGRESGLWRTPAAQSPGVSVEKLVNKDGTPWTPGQRAYDKDTGRYAQVGLIQQIQQHWPTPRAGKTTSEEEEVWQTRKDAGKVSTPPLGLAVKMFPTPTAQDNIQVRQPGDSGKRGTTLGGAARMWATPNSMDHLPQRSPEGVEKLAQGHRKGRTAPSNLREQVDETTMKLWPTPKGSPSGPDYARVGRQGSGGDDLVTAVAKMLPTPSANEDAATLNPAWVCWLMGYELDFLDLDGWQNPELEGLPPEYLTE